MLLSDLVTCSHGHHDFAPYSNTRGATAIHVAQLHLSNIEAPMLRELMNEVNQCSGMVNPQIGDHDETHIVIKFLHRHSDCD